MDKFGFSPNPALDRIKPQSAPHGEDVRLEDLDRVGEARGFLTRETPGVVSRRKSVGPTTPINIRCPVTVAAPFTKFCERERLTYWEAIERLMLLAGVDEQGNLGRMET